MRRPEHGTDDPRYYAETWEELRDGLILAPGFFPGFTSYMQGGARSACDDAAPAFQLAYDSGRAMAAEIAAGGTYLDWLDPAVVPDAIRTYCEARLAAGDDLGRPICAQILGRLRAVSSRGLLASAELAFLRSIEGAARLSPDEAAYLDQISRRVLGNGGAP